MPKSRKRKVTNYQRIQARNRKAKSLHATTPDSISVSSTHKPKPPAGEVKPTVLSPHSQRLTEKLTSNWTGGIRDGRKYQKRQDGSLAVVSKPRSRVKRLREERQQHGD